MTIVDYKKPSPAALERLRVYLIVESREREKQKKIAAARRALSIANKFPPGEYRAKHVSRIFKKLNKLRAA